MVILSFNKAKDPRLATHRCVKLNDATELQC